MKKTLLILITSTFLLTGCATISSNSAFDKNGLPKHQYYIGHGLEFEFQPFENGHLYIVEKNSNLIFLAESLDEDDDYDFEAMDFIECGDDDKAMLESYGINPHKMKLWLYFLPVPKNSVYPACLAVAPKAKADNPV